VQCKSCTYLAHHKLESVATNTITIVVVVVIVAIINVVVVITFNTIIVIVIVVDYLNTPPLPKVGVVPEGKVCTAGVLVVSNDLTEIAQPVLW